MDPKAFCTQSRVLVVAGKGGVGKTTAAASLALMAARCGLETLLIDVEGTAALPTLFGRPGPLGYREVTLVPGGDRGPPASVRGRSLTPDDALLEYLEDHGLRRVSKRLVATGTLDVVATAVPGIRDILVLAKVKATERAAAAGEAGAPDLVVVDAPAAGHAVTFLAGPKGLYDAVSVGPIRKQAGEVIEMIGDPARCQVLLVTMPEETPVNEAIDTAFLLEDRAGVKLTPIVVNGVWPTLDMGGAGPAAEHAGVRLSGAEVAALDAAAAFRGHRQALQADQVRRLGQSLPLEQIMLPYLFTTDLDRADLDTLTDALTVGVEALGAPT